MRKRRYLEHLQEAGLDSLQVSTADKAHNARDQMLDARRNEKIWNRFNTGIDGTAWVQLRIHQTLMHRLPLSLSTLLLGEALHELLASKAYRQLVPEGIAPAVWAAVWAAGYPERHEANQRG